MSNNPPAINPTGTRFRKIRMYGSRVSYTQLDLNHTKSFTKMLKVVGEYIKADYKVTCWEDPPGYMNADCETPMESTIND